MEEWEGVIPELNYGRGADFNSFSLRWMATKATHVLDGGPYLYELWSADERKRAMARLVAAQIIHLLMGWGLGLISGWILPFERGSREAAGWILLFVVQMLVVGGIHLHLTKKQMRLSTAISLNVEHSK